MEMVFRCVSVDLIASCGRCVAIVALNFNKIKPPMTNTAP